MICRNKKNPATGFINVPPQYQANRKKIMIQRDVFETQWFSSYPWGQCSSALVQVFPKNPSAATNILGHIFLSPEEPLQSFTQ